MNRRSDVSDLSRWNVVACAATVLCTALVFADVGWGLAAAPPPS